MENLVRLHFFDILLVGATVIQFGWSQVLLSKVARRNHLAADFIQHLR